MADAFDLTAIPAFCRGGFAATRLSCSLSVLAVDVQPQHAVLATLARFAIFRGSRPLRMIFEIRMV